MPSTLELANVLAVLVMSAIYGYIAFSAFAIGRSLYDRIHRRQAIGIALVIILGDVLNSLVDLGPNANSGPIFVGGFLLYYITFMGFYYWIDTSIRAARLTDPLLRDTFRWSKLRLIFWAYDVGATVFFLYAGVFYGITYETASPAILVFLLGPLFIMMFSGAVVLPIAARRSKDRVLRKHLDWFGVYAIVILGFVFLWGGFVNATNLDDDVVMIIGGYLLYRCVRSLAPLYSFPKEKATAV